MFYGNIMAKRLPATTQNNHPALRLYGHLALLPRSTTNCVMDLGSAVSIGGAALDCDRNNTTRCLIGFNYWRLIIKLTCRPAPAQRIINKTTMVSHNGSVWLSLRPSLCDLSFPSPSPFHQVTTGGSNFHLSCNRFPIADAPQTSNYGLAIKDTVVKPHTLIYHSNRIRLDS